MQKIIDFLESRETYKKVCQKLASYGMGPNVDGFVAGGSVSNILISMLHGGEPVINDIDVYKQTKEKVSNDWYPSTFIDEEGLEIVNDSYGRIFVGEDGSRMKVLGHSRKGILNIISYHYENYTKLGVPTPTEKNLVILQGFDLNCCKAGLDLEKEEIIYTPEFVDYLKTKQLKVIHPCAPIQTTIRIYRKMKDLDCYCDVEHEMRFLTVAAKNVNSGQMSKYIGPETYAKYEKCKEFVDKYFTLREPKNSEEIPYSLKDKYYIGNKRNPDIKIWLFDPVMDFNIIEDVSTINRLKRIWYLLYTYKRGSEQDRINKIFYKNVFLGKEKEDMWYKNDYDRRDDNGQYLRQPYYNSTRYTHSMILTKKDYHKCDFDLKHVDYVDNFAKEHHGMQMFLRNCCTLVEQYELIKFIKSLANKEGNWIIGALENSNSQLTTMRDENNNLFMNIIGKEVIIKLVEKYKKENSETLTEAIDLSGFEYEGCVKELVAKLQLIEEGSKMGHCVGGYSQSIIDGRSRIFHIECDGIGSTIEIGLPVKTYMTSRYPDPLSFRHYDGYPNDIVEIYQDDECEEDECIVVTGNQENQHLRPLERHKIKIHNNLFYTVRQHYGRYPEKGNLTPTDINKDIATELVRYLNMNYLPKNYKIRSEFFANKEDKRIFV